MHWQKITIIGTGLLGGSLGLAIKQRKVATKVHAFVRRPGSIAECEKAGVADLVTQDMKNAVEGADLVVVCTPLSRMKELAERFTSHLKPGALVTDVGSVKESVVADLEPMVRAMKAEFVGSHPMAGSEKIGVANARADLFHDAVCVVTPTTRSSAAAVSAVEHFWKALGGRPVRMSPEMHDDLVSRSSHLPHVVAAELANYVLSPVHSKQQMLVCANGFRDVTRLASGSPEIWRDIVAANQKNIVRVLGVFIEDLREFQLALEREDVKAIDEFFTKAKQRRDEWVADGSKDRE